MDALQLPSALDALPDLAEALAAGRRARVAVFFDYDGTLTPIASRPSAAVLSEEAREAVRGLAELALVVVVSGRGLEEVKGLVDLPGLVYVGSHGLEIEGPEDLRWVAEEARASLPEVEAVAARLARELGGVPGCLVERKPFSVAVHTRLAYDPHDRELVEQEVTRLEETTRGRLRLQRGKEVAEFGPDVPYDKGTAVLWLLDRLRPPMGWDLVLYVGDDETDEAAFGVLAGLPAAVAGIRVGAGRDTLASHRLADAEETRRFLEGLTAVLREG